MLALIRRIGTEFGMHIVVSSHHLEEVERICDAVVIVEGGEVVRAGRLDELRQGPRGSLVEVDDGPTSSRRCSPRAGFAVRSTDGLIPLEPAEGCTTPSGTRSPSSGSACAASGRAAARSRTST